MLVEGIDVYLMLVKVFDTGRSMVTYFYVIGYGGPAVIVVLSVIIVEASGTHGYGTPDQWVIKFIYSEKATKFYEIFTLLLTGTKYDKSKVRIS